MFGAELVTSKMLTGLAPVLPVAVSSDVPVRVVLGIAVRVVDVDVAVGGKGWVQGYA